MAASAVKIFKTVTVETKVSDGVDLHLDDNQAQLLVELLATIGGSAQILTGADGVYGALKSVGYAFTPGYSREHFSFVCGSLYIT